MYVEDHNRFQNLGIIERSILHIYDPWTMESKASYIMHPTYKFVYLFDLSLGDSKQQPDGLNSVTK